MSTASPTREQMCRGGYPSGSSLPSRIPGLPSGVVALESPANASHYRRRIRRRRQRHQLRLGAGHRGELDQGWRRPGSRHQRPSCRRDGTAGLAKRTTERTAKTPAHVARTPIGDVAVEDMDTVDGEEIVEDEDTAEDEDASSW